MKSAFFLLFLVCLSCGGMLPGRSVTRVPAGKVLKVDAQALEQHLYLSVLEKHYAQEKRPIKLAVVKEMKLKLQEKHPELSPPSRHPELKDLRKDAAFISLQFTVEHLSHRESVARH